jgi:DNA-binding Lrp family transcriptional regulator
MRARPLDRIDLKILATLQRDGRMTIQKLAEIVALSPRPCLERVRRLEQAGIIAGYQAILDLAHLGKPITVLAEIALDRHGTRERLEARMIGIAEIVECWEVSGAFDYIARVVCADVAAYETLTAALIEEPGLGVTRIVSHIALRPVKRFAGFPASLLEKSPR